MSISWAQSPPPSLSNIAPSAGVPKQGSSVQDNKEDDVQTIAPDTRRELLMKFQALNHNAREHVLNMPMNAYADTTDAPGLRLNRMWVGGSGALLEIEGLPVGGRAASAVIREDTLTLVYSNGSTVLQAFEGATQLKDRRGGSAIVVKPGEKMLALFGPGDDSRPMRLQHIGRDGRPYVYFENIDPRFRERYAISVKAALDPAATPEQMKDFLVEFAKNDPDGKAREVFLKLINAMRSRNTFEGYYNAYLLIQDPEDARKASQLARSDEHRAMMENIAVAALADKNRLINFDFRLTPTSTTSNEGSCWIFCRYNFTASRPLIGAVTLKLQPSNPIKPKIGTYKVTLAAQIQMPRRKIQDSQWIGNYDGPDNFITTQDVNIILAPPHYVASQTVNFANLPVAFFERGSAGGFTGIYATGNAQIQLQLKSVELVK